MDLRNLHTFELVARHSSFTRVARELGISQPAVSGQIQALEQEVGMRLLERLPRRVQLTPAGETLLTYTRRMLGLEAEALAALAALKGIEDSRLRLGASPTVGAYLLPRLLSEFKQRYPQARVAAEIAATRRVVELLRLYRIDCALVEAPVEEADLVVTTFFTDELVLVVPAGHRWASRASVRPEELREQPLVTREPGSGTRTLIEAALAALGVTVEPSFELGGVEAMKNAVLAGLGVAFLSRQAITEEVRAGSLVASPSMGWRCSGPSTCCIASTATCRDCSPRSWKWRRPPRAAHRPARPRPARASRRPRSEGATGAGRQGSRT